MGVKYPHQCGGSMKIGVSYREDSGVYYENQPLSQLPSLMRLTFLRRTWAYRKQSHTPGFFYFSSLKKHVYYESFLESQILLHLDFLGNARTLIEQPFLLQHANQQHIPDFVYETTNGEVRLINVKPTVFLERPDNIADFALADAAAEQLGWQRVMSELNPFYIDNLQWLSAYRDVPHQSEVLSKKILANLKQPTSLANVILEVGDAFLVKPVVFHLLWHQQLYTNLEQQFSLQMPLWVGEL
jgi:hypothetical protein